MIVCKNCNTAFTGKYCNNCAQKASTGRLKVINVLHELWHNFTHTDKSVLGLIKAMFVNPGKVIQEYIDGKRKKYFNPYTFYLIVTGVLIFVTQKVFAYEDNLYKYRNEYGQYVGKHYNIIQFVTVPFLVLLLKFFWYKRKLNYAEWAAFIMFSFGTINFIQLIAKLLYFPLIKFHYHWHELTNHVTYLILAYILTSFLKFKNKWNILLAILCAIVIMYVVDILATNIALLLWGVPNMHLDYWFY